MFNKLCIFKFLRTLRSLLLTLALVLSMLFYILFCFPKFEWKIDGVTDALCKPVTFVHVFRMLLFLFINCGCTSYSYNYMCNRV